MKPDLLNDMMLFVKVVDNKSFSSTARQFSITKSVVSKHISRLEKTLGAQLLHRTTRNLVLTEAGQALYSRCARIYADVEEAEQAVNFAHEAPRGRLRINAPLSFGHLHLAPIIAEFVELHPEVNVELLLGRGYSDVVENGLDLAILTGDLPDSTLIARRLTIRPMRVCASPQYLEKHGIPEVPMDLYQHNCMLYENSPTGKEWHFQAPDGELIRLKMAGNFKANSSQALEAAAVAGLGIVMLPGYMMTKDIKAGKLVSLMEMYCPPVIGIYAVFPQTRYLAPKVRVFVDFLLEKFSDNSLYWAVPTRSDVLSKI